MVGDYVFSAVVISDFKVMGPIPAKLINWADDPGDPTTISKG